MSQRYLESIRNPLPYPASDTDNPPSRSRTPVSAAESASYRPYSRTGNATPSNPPSRARTPASILELTNPKPYPKADYAYDNPIVKPTAVRASPEKPDKGYQQRDADKPRSKRLTKTRSTPRTASDQGTPTPSDGEVIAAAQPYNGSYKGGSISSLNLALQNVEPDPIKKETSFDVEAGPTPAPRTTSVDSRTKPPKYDELEKEKKHKSAAGAMGSSTIDTTKSSHPMTTKEKREKHLKAGGYDEEDEDDEEVWYKRHEKLLWILCLVFFLVVICFALGLGISLAGGVGDRAGIFASTLGQECRFACRNRARYTNRQHSPLIVLAIDGLPNDVLHDQDIAKNIKRLSDCGVHTHDMISSFASTTYPNLWSILTGQYPESHGVMSDYMRGNNRRVFEPRVSQDNLRDDQWYKAKPLWQLAREQGIISASHSWLGNNIDTEENDYRQAINRKPNYYQPYNSQLTPQDRIRTVLKWIQQDDVEKIPQFITVFFDELGTAIRNYGHFSMQANETLMEIDLAIGSLMDYLHRNQDAACFNIMITAPSGLVPTSCGNDNSNVQFLDEGRDLFGIEMTPDYLNAFARISVSSQANDNFDTTLEVSEVLKCQLTERGSAYTRDQLPSRYHYSSMAVPDDVYVLMKNGQSFAMEADGYVQNNCRYASDGYDPTGVQSTTVFIGFGRDFKVDHGVYEFYSVDVFNLMSKLLGVTPEPNNGTMGVLHDMLTSPGAFPTTPMDLAQESICPVSNRNMADYRTGCSCDTLGQDGAPTAMERGADVFSATKSLAARHVPFGAPKLLASASPDPAGSSCPLYQSSYLLTYDKSLTIAKFASFTLQPGYSQATMPTGCILTDTRLGIGENPRCSSYTDPEESQTLPSNIQQSFLLQPELSVDNADAGIITSNMIPMYNEFETEIWGPLINTYRSWIDLGSTTSNLNIVQGPVYDLNHDGVADEFSLISSSYAWAGDTVVPSHFFVVASRCANTSLELCAPHQVQTLAFVLPHNNMGLPCQSSLADYLLDHRATLQDVERMTGLCFFPDWTFSDDVSVRRTTTIMKTELPYMLWQN